MVLIKRFEVSKKIYTFYSKKEIKKTGNEFTDCFNYVLFSVLLNKLAGTTKKIEKLLIEEGIDMKANILKIAHHGSKTSSSRAFLKTVNPEIAILLVGKDNSYGHPNDETLVILL